MAKPVPLTGGEDGPDRRAYALFDGAVWRSDLTGGLGRDELETQFVPAGAEGPNSRSGIPVAVRRAVWQRDYGRCAKCGRRERLEFDGGIEFCERHGFPFALPGFFLRKSHARQDADCGNACEEDNKC